MAGIFGHLNVNDRDRVFNNVVGQRAIYDTAMQWINERSAELDLALSILVERTTDEFKLRYKLPGSGYLQRRNVEGRYDAVKATGQWDVAFPLEDLGAQVVSNDVDMRYMQIGDLERHLMTVWSQNINSVRYEALRRIFNNLQFSFLDPDNGTLLVEPLANGDATLYPPVFGSNDEATEDLYIRTGYAPSSIDDTNDPLTTVKDKLENHFGQSSNGTDIVVFSASDSIPYLRGLEGFVPVTDKNVRPGDDTSTLLGAPAAHPGVLVGRAKGVWIVEWRHVPTTYMFGVHTMRPAPLIKRKDPEDTGIPGQLELVARDPEFPFDASFWRHRFGFGVGNRLNGVVLQLATSTGYVIPTIFQ